MSEVLGSKISTTSDILISMYLNFGSPSLGAENVLEDPIFTNRIESTKKLKLTSLPSDTPSQPRTESTTSPGSSY